MQDVAMQKGPIQKGQILKRRIQTGRTQKGRILKRRIQTGRTQKGRIQIQALPKTLICFQLPTKSYLVQMKKMSLLIVVPYQYFSAYCDVIKGRPPFPRFPKQILQDMNKMSAAFIVFPILICFWGYSQKNAGINSFHIYDNGTVAKIRDVTAA